MLLDLLLCSGSDVLRYCLPVTKALKGDPFEQEELPGVCQYELQCIEGATLTHLLPSPQRRLDMNAIPRQHGDLMVRFIGARVRLTTTR